MSYTVWSNDALGIDPNAVNEDTGNDGVLNGSRRVNSPANTITNPSNDDGVVGAGRRRPYVAVDPTPDGIIGATPKQGASLPSTSTRPLNISNEAITKLLQWSPANSNLFEVAFSGINAISTLHCTDISFPGSQLSFNRSKGTKRFAIEEYQFSDEVTITWREDSRHSVRRFHEIWFNQFYDRNIDKYISSTDNNPPQSRYRSAIISLQNFGPRALYNSLRLYLIDMLPIKLPDLTLGWSTEANLEYQLSYKITDWKWEWL